MKVSCSIVIPLGRPDNVNSLLLHLFAQNISSVDFEIILVTAQPKKVNVLTNERVRVIATEILYPPGKMRNIGAKKSRGEYLFFIDDDCLPPSEWLEKMVGLFHCDDKIGAVGCRVTSYGSGFWDRCADFALFGAYQYGRTMVRDIGSAALAVRRLAFEEIGGFEETLLASEDWDFNFRLEKKGWKRIFIHSVCVSHNHGRASLRAILKQSHQSGVLSGLVVQNTHKDMKHVSFLTWLSIQLKSPIFYFFLIFPYACAVTLQQIIEQNKTEPKFFNFIPFILMAKCSYHFGVWMRLLRDSKSPTIEN